MSELWLAAWLAGGLFALAGLAVVPAPRRGWFRRHVADDAGGRDLGGN